MSKAGQVPFQKVLLIISLCLLVQNLSAKAQGTLIFRNFWLGYVYTNGNSGYLTNVQRPIFLADGITKAAGTNYVVELLAANYFVDPAAPSMELLGTTHLLEGNQAGLFNGGNNGSITVPGAAYLAFLSIKVWDKRTGSNFETATLRSSISFDNLLGNPGAPPTPPEPLRGFPSLCLGNLDCTTNAPAIEFGSGSCCGVPIVYRASRSSLRGIIPVRRLGELGKINSVVFSTSDLTATNGQEYVAQSGRLTFLPDEALKNFTVPLLPDGLTGKLVTVGLQLKNVDANATLGVTVATLRLYDERPTVRWVSPLGTASRYIEMRAYAGYFRLEHTPTFSPPQWTNAAYGSAGRSESGGQVVQIFLNDAWRAGFYRAVSP